MEFSFLYRNPDSVQANAPTGSGGLHGIRIALQPNISVAGWPCNAGSKALHSFIALEDATMVQRLRGSSIWSGAFLCGTTRMSEFGFGLQGSQAGQALQQQAADAEIVIDLLGESRLAAAGAAVCGFKPSYGLVSRLGLIGLIPSMECCGLLAHGMDPIRDILKAIVGPDDRDFSLPNEAPLDFAVPPLDPHQTTLGVITEAGHTLSADQQERFQASLTELQQAGFGIRELSMPDFALFRLVHQIVGSVEASSCAGRYDSVRFGPRVAGARNWNDMFLRARAAAFGTLLKSYLLQGAFFQFERYGAYEDACRIRARLLAEMAQLSAQVDFLICPIIPIPASDTVARLGETYAYGATTIFANVTGQPTLFLPPAAGAGNTGYQLAGPRRSDARLLALGAWILQMRRRLSRGEGICDEL